MGVLTDPRTGNGKVIKFLLQWEKLLCYLLCLGGIIWMMLLASSSFNDNTYFSENALLPGLVTKESNLMHSSKQFHQELTREMEKHPSGMPYTWMAAKFRQLHLDVYVHNFTLVYPFREQKFVGKNIYGIIRAPRAVSTEAIVVNVPYRPVNTIHASTSASIALLLAFIQFCSKQKYWAKDIVFLVTEHEQLGMHAWLDAYHGVISGQEGTLLAGDLPGRAGSIQAAIVLELHALKLSSIDVKVEGLNGQLPNLDLFNLAQNMISKEKIHRTFQRRFDIMEKDKIKKWYYRFITMMSMMMSQSTGVPTGNHGLFHRFGIEAITLEGFEKTGHGPEANFNQVGRVVESIVRSLNNLLERFHQSFFFYLLPSTNRYISIGVYMPPLVLIIASLFIKAYSIWIKLQDVKRNSDAKDRKEYKKEHEEGFEIEIIASEILWVHVLGFTLMVSPQLSISTIATYLNVRTENVIYYGLAVITILTMSYPIVGRKRYTNSNNAALVCVITSVELATTLMCVAMHNFSLALLIASIYVPITLIVHTNQDSKNRFHKLLYVLWPLLHPFMIASFVVTVYTYLHFVDEPFSSVFGRALQATKQAFALGIIDSMIYGNWLYSFTVSTMLPIWLIFWNIIHCKIS